MKFLFLVQAEGRGHLTQAIVLSKILTSNGHEVVHTFIGQNNRRIIPNYFFEKIDSSIESIRSPNFILDKNNKALKLAKSIAYNARFLGTYRKSLEQIHQKVKETRPHAIINFYEILGGLYFRFYRPQHVSHICIGRPFLSNHPDFPYEPGRNIEKMLYLLNNKITSQNCDKYLALSFRPYDPPRINNTVVVPPLLKDEVKNGKANHEDFLLGYMVNDGYAEDLIKWHKNYMGLKIHCFWDRKDMPEQFIPHENLIFHLINDTLFHDLLIRCKGYISTAGFESICEAMFLEKPVLMVPVEGQYEQACNAIDGEISGAGIRGSSFGISKFIEYLPNHVPNKDFQNWVENAETIFLEELSNF
jgi:uncharacterized protein (TIGR00661 family)